MNTTTTSSPNVGHSTSSSPMSGQNVAHVRPMVKGTTVGTVGGVPIIQATKSPTVGTSASLVLHKSPTVGTGSVPLVIQAGGTNSQTPNTSITSTANSNVFYQMMDVMVQGQRKRILVPSSGINPNKGTPIISIKYPSGVQQNVTSSASTGLIKQVNAPRTPSVANENNQTKYQKDSLYSATQSQRPVATYIPEIGGFPSKRPFPKANPASAANTTGKNAQKQTISVPGYVVVTKNQNPLNVRSQSQTRPQGQIIPQSQVLKGGAYPRPPYPPGVVLRANLQGGGATTNSAVVSRSQLNSGLIFINPETSNSSVDELSSPISVGNNSRGNSPTVSHNETSTNISRHQLDSIPVSQDKCALNNSVSATHPRSVAPNQSSQNTTHFTNTSGPSSLSTLSAFEDNDTDNSSSSLQIQSVFTLAHNENNSEDSELGLSAIKPIEILPDDDQETLEEQRRAETRIDMVVHSNAQGSAIQTSRVVSNMSTASQCSSQYQNTATASSTDKQSGGGGVTNVTFSNSKHFQFAPNTPDVRKRMDSNITVKQHWKFHQQPQASVQAQQATSQSQQASLQLPQPRPQRPQASLQAPQPRTQTCTQTPKTNVQIPQPRMQSPYSHRVSAPQARIQTSQIHPRVQLTHPPPPGGLPWAASSKTTPINITNPLTPEQVSTLIKMGIANIKNPPKLTAVKTPPNATTGQPKIAAIQFGQPSSTTGQPVVATIKFGNSPSQLSGSIVIPSLMSSATMGGKTVPFIVSASPSKPISSPSSSPGKSVLKPIIATTSPTVSSTAKPLSINVNSANYSNDFQILGEWEPGADDNTASTPSVSKAVDKSDLGRKIVKDTSTKQTPVPQKSVLVKTLPSSDKSTPPRMKVIFPKGASPSNIKQAAFDKLAQLLRSCSPAKSGQTTAAQNPTNSPKSVSTKSEVSEEFSKLRKSKSIVYGKFRSERLVQAQSKCFVPMKRVPNFLLKEPVKVNKVMKYLAKYKSNPGGYRKRKGTRPKKKHKKYTTKKTYRNLYRRSLNTIPESQTQADMSNSVQESTSPTGVLPQEEKNRFLLIKTDKGSFLVPTGSSAQSNPNSYIQVQETDKGIQIMSGVDKGKYVSIKKRSDFGKITGKLIKESVTNTTAKNDTSSARTDQADPENETQIDQQQTSFDNSEAVSDKHQPASDNTQAEKIQTEKVDETGLPDSPTGLVDDETLSVETKSAPGDVEADYGDLEVDSDTEDTVESSQEDGCATAENDTMTDEYMGTHVNSAKVNAAEEQSENVIEPSRDRFSDKEQAKSDSKLSSKHTSKTYAEVVKQSAPKPKVPMESWEEMSLRQSHKRSAKAQAASESNLGGMGVKHKRFKTDDAVRNEKKEDRIAHSSNSNITSTSTVEKTPNVLESSVDRIRRLKEMLKQKQMESLQAREKIEQSKETLKSLDL